MKKIILPVSQKEIELDYNYGMELEIQDILFENQEVNENGSFKVQGKSLSLLSKKLLELIPQKISMEEIKKLGAEDGRFLMEECASYYKDLSQKKN